MNDEESRASALTRNAVSISVKSPFALMFGASALVSGFVALAGTASCVLLLFIVLSELMTEGGDVLFLLRDSEWALIPLAVTILASVTSLASWQGFASSSSSLHNDVEEVRVVVHEALFERDERAREKAELGGRITMREGDAQGGELTQAVHAELELTHDVS